MSTDTNQYVVYPNKSKHAISIGVYTLFAFLEGYVMFTEDLKMYWKVLLAILIVFFVWQVVVNIRTVLQNPPLLVISDQGIRDYTSGIDFGLIPWQAIEKIETFPGGNSMQIGVLVSKSFKFSGGSKNANIIATRNKKQTGFTFSIDGFSIGNKFKKTFAVMQEYGLKNKPTMLVKEYSDPIMKRIKKKK